MGFSIFTDLITPTKFKLPEAPQVDITQEQKDTVAGNIASFDAAKGFADEYNTFMQQQLAKSLKAGIPGFENLSTTMAENLAKQLRGELTSSDAAASQRSSAAKSLGLGIAGSPAGAAYTARNLGLTQYQVQQNAQNQAQSYLVNMGNLTKAPMFDFSSIFLTAPQRIAVSQWNKQNQYNRQIIKNQMDVQPDPWMKSLAGFGDSLLTAAASLYGANPGQSNSQAQAAAGYNSFGQRTGGNGYGVSSGGNWNTPYFNQGDANAISQYGLSSFGGSSGGSGFADFGGEM